MGSPNDLIYIQKTYPVAQGPVLEIGCKYNNTGFKKFFKNQGVEYVGTDIEESSPYDPLNPDQRQVDVVCDLTAPENPLHKNYFDLVICCSVMEHVPRPWVMAEKISELVRPGGKLYVAVPWVWKYHGYPKDYYRFTHTAIEYLYPNFSWGNFAWSSISAGDIEFQEMTHITERKMIITDCALDGTTKNKYIKYLSINMLGTKNA
jgi:SAM-dependent methyltransferase